MNWFTEALIREDLNGFEDEIGQLLFVLLAQP